MSTLLVISNEPSLAETLQGELADIAVKTARPKDAAPLLQDDAVRLILADDDTSELTELLASAKAPVIRLARPARLSDLLYTITTRLQGKSAGAPEIALASGCRLLPADRTLCAADGTPIALTEKEVELLACLVETAGKPVARDTLLKRVWGYNDDVATHTLETHIYRLRGKLRQASEAMDIVFSEEGGYRLAL